ncbi:MAG TPA: PAS domain S-box protein [Verrucomicrobiae bacterium]|nr:PAS domain S-box protein [Verrucomicrobiae bacterium]
MDPKRIVLKLCVAFIGLMLVLVAVGWLGLARMSGMRHELNKIVSQRWEHAELSIDALQLSSANNRITLTILLIDDSAQIEALLKQRESNSARISALLSRATETAETAAEQQLLDAVEKRRAAYVAAYREATRIMMEGGRNEEARGRMISQVLPLLNDYHAAWEAFRAFQGSEVMAITDEIEGQFITVRGQLISLVAIGTSLAAAIAAFVSRGLLREIEARGRLTALENTREELERHVAERTSDLKRANEELRASALELSAAHERLRGSEARFRTLSDSAPVGVFLTDGKGTILYSNPYCRRFTGSESESATASLWMQSIHPNDRARVQETIARSCREGSDFECEYRFVGSDGQIRWVHSRAAVLRSADGNVTGRVGTALDVTDRKQAEGELERVHKELLKASREAGIAEVATGVLHNVKNVINSMNVSAALIESEVNQLPGTGLAKAAALLTEHSGDLSAYLTNDPKGKLLPGYLDQLARSLTAQRAAILLELKQFRGSVDHIKEIVCMQQTYASPGSMIEQMDPLAILEDSLRFHLGSLSRHGIEVVRDYSPDLPKVWVEKNKVLQILVNFVRNAKHALRAVERTGKKLVVRAVSSNGFVALSVTDNGVGIDAEHFKRLFEYGFTTKKDGHGFGLHSSALAARELGGDVAAHSDGLGQGACFTLRIPISRKSNPPTPLSDPTAASVAGNKPV